MKNSFPFFMSNLQCTLSLKRVLKTYILNLLSLNKMPHLKIATHSRPITKQKEINQIVKPQKQTLAHDQDPVRLALNLKLSQFCH